MSLLKRLAYGRLTRRTSEAWRAEANRHVKVVCSDFLLEHQRKARTGIPTVESSAEALRPGTPIFATLLLIFFSMIGVDLSSAMSPDIRLMSLIPPGSEVIAGIRAPLVGGLPSNYLFITKDNRIDLADFIAMSGSDQSRIINQVIFTASSGQNGKPVNTASLSADTLINNSSFEPRAQTKPFVDIEA